MSWLGQFSGRTFVWALVAAFVVVAALVNWLAPAHRKRLRRVVIMLVVALVAELASSVLDAAHQVAWHDRLEIAAQIVEAFVLINLVVILAFDVVIGALGIAVPVIASDIIAGAGYFVAALGVFHHWGMNPTSVVGASAVVSAVLALSLQSTLGNVIGGVALQLDGSVKVGDWIALENGRQGRVKEIRWRHSVLETRDWGTLIVPNSTLLQGQILVLGKREGKPEQHRYWVYFNVDYRFAPSKVIAVVNEALQQAPIANVAADPKPHAIVVDFSRDGKESFAYYAVRYWLTDLAVDDPTSSVIRQRIYMALKRAAIPLARPTNTTFVAAEEDASVRNRRHHASRVALLGKLALFSPLTDAERERLAEHLVYAPFVAGETVTRRGNVAHWLYLVVDGTVSIQLTEGTETRELARIAAPGFFGEMGMMTGEPRAADVVSATEVECYRLDKSGFQHIILARPELAREMSRTMAERRAELVAARDGLEAEQKAAFAREEQERLVQKIEEFFGLS